MMFKFFSTRGLRKPWNAVRPVGGAGPQPAYLYVSRPAGEGAGAPSRTKTPAGMPALPVDLQSRYSRFFLSFLSTLLVLPALSGCRLIFPRLPAANIKEPGWKVQEGQAVWRLPKNASEIAGEVLVATRPDGHAFVQFTKGPFPMVIAQTTTNAWEVQFPSQNRHYSGRGTPPARIIWLYLPRALSGKALPRNWTWQQEASGWKLENKAKGESLEGYFTSQ